MKSSLVPSNDPRFEEWRRISIKITDLSSDSIVQLRQKAELRVELSKFVQSISVWDDVEAENLLDKARNQIAELDWSPNAEEYKNAKEINKDLYDLKTWYEDDIDLCFIEKNMLELYSTLLMWVKTLKSIWKLYHDRLEIESYNPWEETPIVESAAKHQQENKKNRGRKKVAIEEDGSFYQESLFDYAQELYERNGIK